MLTSTILESTCHCHHIPANVIIIHEIFKKEPEAYAVVFDVDQTASCGASEREHQPPAPGRSKAGQILCV